MKDAAPQLRRWLHRKDLVIIRNGEPLPGSISHPETMARCLAAITIDRL